MFISPYQTKAASWNPIDKIQSAMKLAKVEKRLISTTKPIPGLTGIYGPTKEEGLWLLIDGITGNNTEIAFTNPVTFTDTLGRQNIVIDARKALSMDYTTNTIVMRNRSALMDLQQQIIRMKAIWYWMSGNQRDFLNLSPVPMQVFVRWIGEGLARNLGIGYDVMPRFMAYIGWWFFCQFYDEGDVDESVRMNGIRKINEQAKVRIDFVSDVLANAPYIGTAQQFCDNATDIVGADELMLLDMKMLLRSAGNAWWGAHAAESGAIGLEYPPVFLSMLYGSADNKAYRITALGKILDRGEFKKSKEVFMRSFSGTLDL